MADLRPLEAEPAVRLDVCLLCASLSTSTLSSQTGFLCEQQQCLKAPVLCFPKLSTGEEATLCNFHTKTIQGQDCD